jgi:hypothetical protein
MPAGQQVQLQARHQHQHLGQKVAQAVAVQEQMEECSLQAASVQA